MLLGVALAALMELQTAAATSGQTVGPALDPIAGEVVDPRTRRQLPSGRHPGSTADLWFVNLVNQQFAGGGMAFFDPLRVSAHGRSWTQMHFFLNGFDVTDPARPGTPLVVVPHHAWDSMRSTSLFASRAKLAFSFRPEAHPVPRFGLGYGKHIGGGTWVPRGLMDREPGVAGGPLGPRRRLERAGEVFADGGMALGAGALRLHVEHVEHLHTYPTLRAVDGARRDDVATRTSLLAGGAFVLAGLPWTVTAAWQGERRPYAGAEFRFPEALTRSERGGGMLAQVGTHAAVGPGTLQLGVGAGYRDDDAPLHSQAPQVQDLEDAWMWLARPRFGKAERRGRLVGLADYRCGDCDGGSCWRGKLEMNWAWLREKTTIPGARSGVTYARGDTTVSQVHYDEPSTAAAGGLRSLQVGTDYHSTLGDAAIDAHLGLDHAAVVAAGSTQISHLSPAAGLAFAWPVWGSHKVFGLVRWQPQALTHEVLSFVYPTTNTGNVYRWDDRDGDRVPEAGEEGALLRRTGGAYHRIDPHLRRPFERQMALGWRSQHLGPFSVVVLGVARWLTHRHDVRLQDTSSFVPQTFHDPGGDGRGEETLSGGGQELPVYARVGPGGDEWYVLGNAAKADFYLGLEAQMLSVDTRFWFVNIGGAAYLSEGGAPFGSFPDRNDPGIVDEASADPNNRVLQRGRYDHDRSFALNVLAGITPGGGLEASCALRYRDGQPFTRIVVADDLPQGPVALMAVRRGKPRHTFHMTLDTRLQYGFAVAGAAAYLVLDVYNLLGSGTEYLEDPRTGQSFREVLEMVPGRGMMLSLQINP